MPRSYCKAAFRRRHLYSAILVNLCKVKTPCNNYLRHAFCWEDIHFDRATDADRPPGVLCKVYRFAMSKKTLRRGGAAEMTAHGAGEGAGGAPAVVVDPAALNAGLLAFGNALRQ